MSARMPSRRLGQSALAAYRPRSTCSVTSAAFSTTTQRSNDAKEKDLSNPILESFFAKQEAERRKAARAGRPVQPSLRHGELSKSPTNLFRPELDVPGWREGMTPREKQAFEKQNRLREEALAKRKERELTSMNLDPAPERRRTLERRLIIASVKRGGRMTKAQKIARTERQSVYKSHFLPTSVKKLQKVVNQIAGKSVSEALVQLRFSPKKVARDVIKGLEIAQNEAIAARGMGLSGGRSALERWQQQRANADQITPRDVWDYKVSPEDNQRQKKETQRSQKPETIELKDGTKKTVQPWDIYIDQAWVGKGESWKTPEFRARGAINMLTHRTTSFTVLLKEEKTRMRISEEIKKKRDNRKLWTALPDRPVTSQRQYCLW
ncbi:ribosomal protein L22 [Plenodomus tracheiphilus IPT5]|uniref:Ribosomal protein L22 n=1 Tax=Plenodomus tracheiphilus IPT5 TaxID=1408161 RepID=A0A6A7BFM7_9PLEO|nr:ribosomal protein L22 [Plenodomus tracheiphilus IPT5]